MNIDFCPLGPFFVVPYNMCIRPKNIRPYKLQIHRTLKRVDHLLPYPKRNSTNVEFGYKKYGVCISLLLTYMAHT